MIKSIAILITAYNRKEKTLSCIKSILRQKNIEDINVKIYLVDDGSSDGTGNEAKQLSQNITLIEGNGNLYWNGGMRLAWLNALELQYDAYIWINDDVQLFDEAIKELLSVHGEKGNESIITGTMIDPLTNKRSYGGAVMKNKKEIPLMPNHDIQEADIFSGNFVLIPENVVKKIGILDKKFTHGLGDYDYALRARKSRINIYVARGYQGYCTANIGVAWLDPDISFRKRWRHLHSPKGPHPRECLIYALRHKSWKAPLTIARIYFYIIFLNIIKSR